GGLARSLMRYSLGPLAGSRLHETGEGEAAQGRAGRDAWPARKGLGRTGNRRQRAICPGALPGAPRVVDPLPKTTKADQKRGCSSGRGVGPSRCWRTARARASATATSPLRAAWKVATIRSRVSALSIGQSAAIMVGTPASAKDVERP